MCLGVPGKVVAIEGNIGTVSVGEIKAPVNLQLTPAAGLGDFVMVHAGFALKVMDTSAVTDTLALFETVAKTEARADALIRRVHDLADGLPQVKLMEVCGTHTVAIARSGLKARLPKNITLISGPGCPVCVTPVGEIDRAVDLALSGQARIVTFGDMLRVPGSTSSLEEARARGAKVDVVYSPSQALDAARRELEETVFLAVGFETTAPIVAAVVKEAAASKLDNFGVLVSHRLVPPALEAILADARCDLDALICPGHVSTVIGSEVYADIAKKHDIPCVVAGFEPTDVLEAIVMILDQIRSDQARVGNQYKRSVSPLGNVKAQKTIEDVFTVANGDWRGLGPIANSSLAVRLEFTAYDAAVRFKLKTRSIPEPAGCSCGAILNGRLTPTDCRLFAGSCTPDNPIGPCMVSSEGACSAVYLYGDQ